MKESQIGLSEIQRRNGMEAGNFARPRTGNQASRTGLAQLALRISLEKLNTNPPPTSFLSLQQ